MLVPLSWLKDYVDIDIQPKELEEKLFSCGFEVEELYEIGKHIEIKDNEILFSFLHIIA